MAYEALARKWRPQQFDDVVGQEHVTRTLRNAIRQSRLHHAYLFVGPRGIGKTSIARIFAKALCCLNGGPTETPCDQCENCREIMGGNNLDVIEIDGASNNGVEQVRALRDTVKFAPARSPFKIYIIDEVHMLSSGAFNALLKTLEEPPPHVKFMFATTEPERVLPTIISRCQRFDLRRIAVGAIVERLGLIADSDGIEADPDALLAVARGAEGGLRDAESALDQLIAFTGKRITEADVLTVFGLVSRETLDGMVTAVLEGQLKELLATVQALDDTGKDLSRLVVELISSFRNLLVFLNVDTPESALDVPERQLAVYAEQAKLTNTGRLLRVVTLLSEAENRMRYALSRRILLETVLIRCARAATVVTLDEILDKINALREQQGSGGSAKTINQQVEASYEIRQAAKAEPIVCESDGRAGAPESVPSGAGEGKRGEAVADASDQERLVRLQAKWSEVVGRVSRLTPGASLAMKELVPISVHGDVIELGFNLEFRERMDIMQQPRTRSGLTQVLRRLLGFEVRVSLKGVDGALPDVVGEHESKVTTGGGQKSRRRSDWYTDPHVRQVLEAFNGDIEEVK